MKNTKFYTPLIAASALLLCSTAFAGGHDADKKFKMMDTDADGKISRAEHAAGAKQMFTKCDANNDGVVTAAEMDTAMNEKSAKSDKSDKADKHRKSSAELIKEIDTNGDGQLTLAEHDAGTEKMFAKMDKNSDGSLSKDECDEGHKEMKKH
jgi:Ca2+-binding EF-hand superfamily protein